MTAETTDTAADTLLGRWVRDRGFGPSPVDTASGWWLAPVNYDEWFQAYSYKYNETFDIPVTAIGQEIIDVLDIEDGLAQFRHYIVNPVGVRLSWLKVPRYETIQQSREIMLRKKLQRLGMRRYVSRQDDHGDQSMVSPLYEGDNVIAFPASRIVRRRSASSRNDSKPGDLGAA